jgi:hypothetical protein
LEHASARHAYLVGNLVMAGFAVASGALIVSRSRINSSTDAVCADSIEEPCTSLD